MVSRIVLALQYFLIMWHVRKYENAKIPFVLIAGVNLIAAAVYLGVKLLVSAHNFSCQAIHISIVLSPAKAVQDTEVSMWLRFSRLSQIL